MAQRFDVGELNIITPLTGAGADVSVMGAKPFETSKPAGPAQPAPSIGGLGGPGGIS